MNDESHLRSIIGDFSFFKNLPDTDIDFLLTSAVIRKYSKRAFVFTQGNPAHYFFIIISGWVKAHNMNAKGDQSAVHLLTKGDVLGVDTIFDRGSYLSSAETVSDECQMLEIFSETLKEQARISPELAEKLLGLLSHKIKEMQVSDACSVLGDSSRRLACLLLRLSSWMVGKGGTLKLPYEKSIAALQLGMDQATLSRALTSLSDLSVTSKCREITINNFSRLSEYCCVHCPIPEGHCAGRRIPSEKRPQEN